MSIVTELDFLKYRRTKIVATIGPASNTDVLVGELIEAGVDLFRVNMSHGTHEAHGAAIAIIREMSEKLGKPTAILADLCGPKIRTGKFHNGSVHLSAGNAVTVTTAEVMGDETVIPSQYQALPDDVRPGDRVLLNDGAVELQVVSIDGRDVHCEVIAGGPVGDNKGINLPDSEVSAPSLTDKDRIDAAVALESQVDFLALSFVRSGADVAQLREIVEAA